MTSEPSRTPHIQKRGKRTYNTLPHSLQERQIPQVRRRIERAQNAPPDYIRQPKAKLFLYTSLPPQCRAKVSQVVGLAGFAEVVGPKVLVF